MSYTNYKGDKRTLTMEQLEELLLSVYGTIDRIRGCYVNGRWLSIDDVLRIVSDNI